MLTTDRRFGAQSMTGPLLDVLVKPPGPAFGRAFDVPGCGFLHPVDLELARRQHDAFTDLLASLGPRVHVLDGPEDSPDLVYTFDAHDREGVAPLLRRLDQLGIAYADMNTTQSSLEDIFVSLIHKPR